MVEEMKGWNYFMNLFGLPPPNVFTCIITIFARRICCRHSRALKIYVEFPFECYYPPFPNIANSIYRTNRVHCILYSFMSLLCVDIFLLADKALFCCFYLYALHPPHKKPGCTIICEWRQTIRAAECLLKHGTILRHR